MTHSNSCPLRTRHGEFDSTLYEVDQRRTVLALTSPWKSLPFVRIHSACLFGEAFGSLQCDCEWQLDFALERLKREGGAVIYLFQEGRGAGLLRKMMAMNLENRLGCDTAGAFAELGLPQDLRSYDDAIEVLRALNLPHSIRLATSNPYKFAAVKNANFEVVERIDVFHQLPSAIRKTVAKTRRALGHFDPPNKARVRTK
jgi:GTP cyclohydrolase II